MFFITGTTSKSTIAGGSWYSLTATLTHEIGHLLGFGDQADSCQCKHSGSIMNYNYDFTSTSPPVLNSDDSCMYKKMYCWTPPTGVEDSKVTEQGMKIFPNPANNDILNLQFGNPEGLFMAYEIVSSIGNSVMNGNIMPNENSKIIVLDNLSAGAYYIILKHDGKQEMKQFIINK